MGTITIAQIVVETDGGTFGIVSLPPDKMDILFGFIADLSEGPVKILMVPKLKPISIVEAL